MAVVFESLKDLCHFGFTLGFLLVARDAGSQLPLQQPCLPVATRPFMMVITRHSGTVNPNNPFLL